MRRLLTFLFSAFAVSAFGATGDVTACNVRDDGWSVDVVFEGYSTNCVYDLKYTSRTNIAHGPDGSRVTNIVQNIPTSDTPYLAVMSPGFDATGTSNWSQRIVLLTTAVRSNYPNWQAKDERRDAGLAFVTNRLALQDWVYPGEVATLTMSAATYSNNAAVSGMAVVNNSLLEWPQLIALPSRPAWMNIETSADETYQTGISVFHGYAGNGSQVACVKFWGEDNLGNSNSVVTVTRGTIDRTWADATPVIEYVPTLSYANLTGQRVTNRWIAYPRYGTNTLSSDSPHLRSREVPMFNNRSNLAYVVARVSAASGNDTTGVATAGPLNVGTPPNAFATVAIAAAACVRTNYLLNTRSNNALNRIYLEANDNIVWSGATASNYGSNSFGYLTIEPYPGLTRSQVVIRQVSGSVNLINNLRLKNLTLMFTNNNSVTGYKNLWLDGCYIDFLAPGTAHLQDVDTWYLTGCRVTNWNSQGIAPAFSQLSYPMLVRGNDLSGYANRVLPINFIGNVMTNNNPGFTLDQTTATNPSKSNTTFIVAFNRLYGLFTTSGSIVNFGLLTNVSGGAFVQNVLESRTNSPVAAWNFCKTDPFVVTNWVMFNNTFVGNAVNINYNEAGSTAYWKRQCFIKNNFFDDLNLAADISLTPNGGRIGPFETIHGVGLSGNVFGEIGGVGTHPGSYLLENVGVRGDRNPTSVTASEGQLAVRTNFFIGYFNNLAFRGTGTTNLTTGGGDYRLTSTALHQHMQCEPLIEYDIDGVPRSTAFNTNAYGWTKPGAYSSSAPRKGDFIGL